MPYPSIIHSLTTLLRNARTRNLSAGEIACQEVAAIEKELGTNPSGSYATVGARLDAGGGSTFDGGTVHHTTQFYPAGVDEPPIIASATEEPPDGADGQIAFWYDGSVGLPMLRAKGRDSAGAKFRFKLPLEENLAIIGVGPVNAPDASETTFIVGFDVETNTLAVYVNGLRMLPTNTTFGHGQGFLDGDVAQNALSFDIIWPLQDGQPWPHGGAPLSPPFYLTFDATGEILKCTALGGAQNRTLTVERAKFGTTAADTNGALKVYLLTHFVLAAPPASNAVILLDYQHTTRTPTGL